MGRSEAGLTAACTVKQKMAGKWCLVACLVAATVATRAAADKPAEDGKAAEVNSVIQQSNIQELEQIRLQREALPGKKRKTKMEEKQGKGEIIKTTTKEVKQGKGVRKEKQRKGVRKEKQGKGVRKEKQRKGVRKEKQRKGVRIEKQRKGVRIEKQQQRK